MQPRKKFTLDDEAIPSSKLFNEDDIQYWHSDVNHTETFNIHILFQEHVFVTFAL